MRAPLLVSCGLTLALAGCAAAVPGYVPDKARLKMLEKAKADPAATSPSAEGPYVPTARERGYSCRRLTGVMQLKLQQLRGNASQPTSAVTSLAAKAMERPMAGGSLDHSRDRARLVALNELMIEKKCGHFDIDAALDPASTGTPEPIRPEGKPPKKRR